MATLPSSIPTLRVEGKDWSGLTTSNHLGALFGEKPILINDFISRLQYMDLGEDLIGFLNKFPVKYIEDDREYEWLLQGADRKNIPLVEATDIDGSAFTAAAQPGKNGARFLMVFPEKLFFQQHVIVGEKPDLYHVLLRSDGNQVGANFVYEAELVTSEATTFIPVDELAAGTRWSADYSLSEQVLSKKGSDISFTSPFRMANRMSMIRKEHTVPGEMINKRENDPVVFGLHGSENKKITTWLNKLDWSFLREFRTEKANLLMFGKSNRRADGTYGNVGDSGYEIKAGLGIREQISPSNIFHYSVFDIETFVDYALSLSVGKLPQDARRFVVATGEHGLKVISRAIEQYASANALEYNRIKGISGGNKGMFHRPQFVKLAEINGIVFEFIHMPSYDDSVRNKTYHPDGGLAESHRMTIMDFGTADGNPNIQLVRAKGFDEVFGYLPGLRDPYSPGGLKGNPKIMASPVDGYTIHKADWCGAMVRNPMRMGEWIPNVLAA
jgi:hypothetical protein